MKQIEYSLLKFVILFSLNFHLFSIQSKFRIHSMLNEENYLDRKKTQENKHSKTLNSEIDELSKNLENIQKNMLKIKELKAEKVDINMDSINLKDPNIHRKLHSNYKSIMNEREDFIDDNYIQYTENEKPKISNFKKNNQETEKKKEKEKIKTKKNIDKTQNDEIDDLIYNEDIKKAKSHSGDIDKDKYEKINKNEERYLKEQS